MLSSLPRLVARELRARHVIALDPEPEAAGHEALRQLPAEHGRREVGQARQPVPLFLFLCPPLL